MQELLDKAAGFSKDLSGQSMFEVDTQST